MTSIAHKKTDLTPISSYTYGYDDAGQRKFVKRADGNGDVYKYDAINQLTNVLYEAASPDTTPSAWTNEARYVFDAAGNRTSVTLTNVGTTSYTANNVNQYTAVGGVTPTYDANGNLTYDGTWTYTWDRENRLIQAANGSTTIAYAYNVFHRLIKRTIGSSEIRFYYDDRWRLVEERDENDAVLAKYVYGPEIDEPVRMTRNSVDYYYHAAALGTVTEITSSVGNLVEQYRYDVYGEPQSASGIGNRLLFDGRDRDPYTGIYNIRYRWYSPGLGRWFSRDPLRERGGRNLYGFVYNDVVNKSDPTGQAIWWDCVVCAGAIGAKWQSTLAGCSFGCLEVSSESYPFGQCLSECLSTSFSPCELWNSFKGNPAEWIGAAACVACGVHAIIELMNGPPPGCDECPSPPQQWKPRVCYYVCGDVTTGGGRAATKWETYPGEFDGGCPKMRYVGEDGIERDCSNFPAGPQEPGPITPPPPFYRE